MRGGGDVSPKEFCIRIVRGSFGDDLERAKAAFRNHTPDDMRRQYGQSGQTCQQIVDGYQADRDERQAALDWLQGVS